MKLTAIDLPKLQFSLLAAVLMIALGVGTVYFSLNWNKAARSDQSTAQRERDEAAGKLRRVSSEEIEIKQKSAVFGRLQARGMIGDEQRLDWVELLNDIRSQRGLIELHYEFAPQRALDAASGDAYTFYASAMKVELKLLHEEDLTRFLSDLRQQAKALILTRNCDVSRLPPGGSEQASPAHLIATCQIDWVTLRESTAKPGEGKGQ